MPQSCKIVASCSKSLSLFPRPCTFFILSNIVSAICSNVSLLRLLPIYRLLIFCAQAIISCSKSWLAFIILFFSPYSYAIPSHNVTPGTQIIFAPITLTARFNSTLEIYNNGILSSGISSIFAASITGFERIFSMNASISEASIQSSETLASFRSTTAEI